MVADVLSRNLIGSLAHIAPIRRSLVGEIHKLEMNGVQFDLGESGVFLAYVRAQSSLVE